MYKVKRFSQSQKKIETREFGNKENKAKKKAWEKSIAAKESGVSSWDADNIARSKAKGKGGSVFGIKFDGDSSKFDVSKDEIKLHQARWKNKNEKIPHYNFQVKDVNDAINYKTDSIKYSKGNEVKHKLAEAVEDLKKTNKYDGYAKNLKDKYHPAPSKLSGLSKNAKIAAGLAAGTAVVGAGAYGVHKYKKNKKDKEAKSEE